MRAFDFAASRTPAVVASSSEYFEPVLDVGSSPLNVPGARLAAAVAERRYHATVSAEYYSQAATWDDVLAFLAQVAAVSYEHRGRRHSSVFAETEGEVAIVVEAA